MPEDVKSQAGRDRSAQVIGLEECRMGRILEKIVRTTSRTTKWCGVMQAKICSHRSDRRGDLPQKDLRGRWRKGPQTGTCPLPKEMRIV
jgi:hypothetical protein